jgi:AAHS family 4-hydroxybenzoate transporter-like MFS transporter
MAETVDVADIIDRQKIGRYQCLIALMAWLTLFLDGIDNQSIAYAAPALTNAWHLGRGLLGPVFAAGVLGVAVGALVVGPLADRFGRKRVTVGTVFQVALFSFLVSQSEVIAGALRPVLPGASDINVLMWLRFMTGLGLGAVVPLGVVIVNEFAPRRRRAAMVTLMGCGYAVGSASGGVLASHLIPAFGWQTQFYFASGLTLAMAVVLALGLPESIRLLTIKGRFLEVADLLARINPALKFPAGTVFVIRRETPEAGGHRPRPIRLFTQGRAAVTSLLWLCFFMNLLALNYLNNWLPTLTVATGLPQGVALRAAASLQFGGMLGVVSMGFLADRFGFFRVLSAAFALCSVFIAAIGWAGADFYRLAATIFVAGFCNIGSQITLAALAATLYPTDIRSTGVAWAHGVARVASIASVLMAGVLLAQHWPLTAMYYLVAIPMLCGSLLILLLGQLRAGAVETPEEPEPARRAMA